MLSKYVEEQIIQNHLMGFTRDEIARGNNVATGTVSNKINEWKKRTEIPDVDELRQITTLIRKSGVDVRQCAKGFRILQSLKKFDIVKENEAVDSDIDDLSFFINEIYLKCKEYGIGPNIITAWITDLLNFTINNYQYLYKGNAKTSSSTSSEIVNQIDKNNLIPSVSLVSDFIEVKKRDLEQLLQTERNTRNTIRKHEEQIKELEDEVASLKQEKESILVFHETFTHLENILRNDCDINLRKDLEPFTKVFYDFKEKGYNVTSIVHLYEKASKIEWDIKTNENQIQGLNNQLSELHQNIRSSQSILDMHRMKLDLYQQLDVMKFGINELKQLWLTVSEIRHLGDSLKDFDRSENPVAFFIKDVENNYYDKLKFEDRVNEKREELDTLNFQVKVGRQNLLSQPWIASTLLSLFKRGITEQDIVEMSRIFNESRTMSDLLSDDSRNENVQSDASSNKDTKGWKKLREELKNYGGLKAAINERNNQLHQIEREHSSLVFQTQTLGLICQNIFNFINIMNASISQYRHCKEVIDTYFKEMEAYRCKNNLILIPIVVLLTIDPKEDSNKRKTTLNESNKEYEHAADVDNHKERENI